MVISGLLHRFAVRNDAVLNYTFLSHALGISAIFMYLCALFLIGKKCKKYEI
jgi:hypothetical protein